MSATAGRRASAAAFPPWRHAQMRYMMSPLIVVLAIAPQACRAVEPETIMRRAENLIQAAENAAARGDRESAAGRYRLADEALEALQRDHPSYRAFDVGALRGQCAVGLGQPKEKEEESGLPEGYIRIWPGMIREGNRATRGQALAGRVEDVGDFDYNVEGNTVTIARAGSLIGASCTCPDYTYRGMKGGFVCKHIWAVVYREKLLEGAR